MPHVETYEFRGKPIEISMHLWGRCPEVYVEYGPHLHHEYGYVVSAAEFVAALASLPPDEPAVRPLSTVRDCCGFCPWTSVIERAIWWRPAEAIALQIGQNTFTAGEFRRLVEWLASVPFLDLCHEPHVELDEVARAQFKELCRRLGIQAPQHAA